MKTHVNHETKIVEIWLSHDEQNDAAFMESLKSRYREYAGTKYLVAVYRSGNRDLFDATSDLLCYNRKRLAQRDVEAERQQGMIMTM